MQGFLRKLTTWLQSEPRPKRRRTRFHLELLEDRCLLSNAPLPQLSSDPGAPASLYLDFMGMNEPTWGAYSNVNTPQFHLDGTGTGFTPKETAAINEVWERVSEIYSPFNINVTTVQPADLSHGHTQIVAIGGSYNDWFHVAAGGISYVGSFTNASLPNVSHVFVDGTDGVAQYIAIAAAHEAGHGFGLYHQSTFDASGNVVAEYNPGDSAEAPIMGLAYSAARAVWWDGPSDINGVDTYQNDEAVIGGAMNGFGYRPDAFGQSEQTATPLTVLNGQIGASGVIDTPTSADDFTFTTSGGTASFTVNTVAVGATLHARVELYSDAGLIAIGDSPTALGASLTAKLGAGKYYVVVTSYNGMGDVGQYTLSANVPQATAAIAGSTFTKAATYTLTSDQALWAQDSAGNWRLLSPAQTILSISTSTDTSGNPEVFALATDHSLWVNRQGVWYMLSPAGTIDSASASNGDEVFALASNHSLWVNIHSVWSMLSPADTVSAISVSTNDAVFVLASNHSLWINLQNAWTMLSPANTISEISASPGDVVFAVATDASLWIHSVVGWRELSPAGTIASVTAGVDASGQPDAFVLATNNTHWVYTQAGWAPSTQSTAPANAAPVTPKTELPKQAPVVQDAASVQQSTTVATTVVTHPLFPHEPFIPLCMCPWCIAARLKAAQYH